ncbi:MAG: glycosyltransferase family 2 protein [Chloroflexota bacterium]|jgi:glycosyltransferase involved in cell wall biosynthesis|nr:glycosyltransferase family A protein [Candidatus Sulfotelmatobacter sp.]
MSSERIDVVVLTKNSERMLQECLESIYETVPVNRLIIVDGYSTDETLKIVDAFQEKYRNIITAMDNGTRGSARLKGIRLVETDWFLFVDSDVTLCNGWFVKAKRLVNKDIGAVWGTEVWDGIQNSVVLQLFLKITRRIFDLRGGTHDLLVRREAVKDIKIPRNLHVFEDAFIKDWITKKGYKLIATYDPYCIHFRPAAVWTFKGSLDIIIDAFRFGSLSKMPKLFLAYGFYTVYVVYRNLFQRRLS